MRANRNLLLAIFVLILLALPYAIDAYHDYDMDLYLQQEIYNAQY